MRPACSNPSSSPIAAKSPAASRAPPSASGCAPSPSIRRRTPARSTCGCATRRYFIGEAEPRQSYPQCERLIAAAKKSGAECVHPGYGFLSENADFAEACAQAGIVFVGPPADAIRAMGLKDLAKALMEKARVPVVPGYHGERQDAKFLKEKAYEIGYPVLIKPAAGGGGRGMRRVDKHADFDAALEGAMREAQSSFGSSRVLVEKYRSLAAPYRGSGLRRQFRQRHSSRRAGLFACSGGIRR